MSVRGGIAACGSGSPSTCHPWDNNVHLLATLCRFDHKPAGRSYLGPFIPCQRRLAIMEILRIQGRDFTASFLR